MSGEHTGILETPYLANEALTKFRFVKLAGDEAVDQCDTAGEACLGVGRVTVSAAEATAGKGTHVTELGVSFVQLGGTVTRGDFVTTDNVGRAVTAATGNYVHGVARKSGVVGDWIPISVTPNSHVSA